MDPIQMYGQNTEFFRKSMCSQMSRERNQSRIENEHLKKLKLLKKSIKSKNIEKKSALFHDLLLSINISMSEGIAKELITIFESKETTFKFESIYQSFETFHHMNKLYRTMLEPGKAVKVRKCLLKRITKHFKTIKSPKQLLQNLKYWHALMFYREDNFTVDYDYEYKTCQKLLKIGKSKEFDSNLLKPIWMLSGKLSMKSKNFNQAIKEYRKALKIGKQPEIIYKIGLCHLELGNADLARKTFLHCLNNNDRLDNFERFILNEAMFKLAQITDAKHYHTLALTTYVTLSRSATHSEVVAINQSMSLRIQFS